jgi:hypothetical protein
MDEGYKLLFYASDIIGLFSVYPWEDLGWMILQNNDVGGKEERAGFWTFAVEKYQGAPKIT